LRCGAFMVLAIVRSSGKKTSDGPMIAGALVESASAV